MRWLLISLLTATSISQADPGYKVERKGRECIITLKNGQRFEMLDCEERQALKTSAKPDPAAAKDIPQATSRQLPPGPTIEVTHDAGPLR